MARWKQNIQNRTYMNRTEQTYITVNLKEIIWHFVGLTKAMSGFL